MAGKPRAYRAFSESEESPRMPERKRSHRARSESIARRRARALKLAGVIL